MKYKLFNLYFSVLDWLYVGFVQAWGYFFHEDPQQYLQHRHSGKIPIVIVPGVYEPWFIMQPIIQVVANQGYPVYVIEKLGYNTNTIPAAARTVSAFIKNLDAEQVIIIAHSQGGLVGKYLLANHNMKNRIKHLIAINTPFSGSVYADFVPIKAFHLLSPKNRLIRKLVMNHLVDKRITSIYTVHDPNIPSTSFLKGARNIKISVFGHYRILKDPELHEIIMVTIRFTD